MRTPVRVFLSYSHDSREHQVRVLALANRLRRDGIDADVDQYEASPPEGWPRWMVRHLRTANFVLVVCTETYLRRFDGHEEAGHGRGVRWESLLTQQELYDSDSENHRFIPVCFEGTGEFVPVALRGATLYSLSSVEGYAALLLRLQGKATAERPPLGASRELPPRNADPAFFTLRRNNFIEAGLARSTRFVGREEALRSLHEQLGQGSVALAHALSGEGGVGKTLLAIEYAHRYADSFDGVWWVDAARDALVPSVTRLASLLSIQTENVSPEELRTAVCRLLSRGRNLLILDNLERVEDIIAFSLQAPARLLVTTRLARLPSGRVTTMQVQTLERDASIQLLTPARMTPLTAQEARLLDAIAEHLGDHPLALDLASEYLRKYPDVSPEELLRSLQRTEVGDLESPLEDAEPGDIGLGYQLKVAMSLGLHLAEFEGGLGELLLALMAFCHPDAIPMELLFIAVPAAREEVRRWVRRLADVSILRYEQSIRLHRLTQSVIRSRLGAWKTRDALSRLVGGLGRVFGDPKDHRLWPMQETLAPHALSALESLRKERLPEPPGMGAVLAHYLQIRGLLDEALWVLHAGTQFVSPGEDSTFEQCVNIGNILYSKGRLEDALNCYRQAERLLAGQGDSASRESAVLFNNIGDVFRKRQEWNSALEYYRRVEAAYREMSCFDLHDFGAVLGNIGLVLVGQKHRPEAKRYFDEAEVVSRRIADGNHPLLAMVLMYLGEWWRDAGNREEAWKHYAEAAGIAIRTMGGMHELTTRCVETLISLAQGPGELDEALRRLDELEASGRALGGDAHAVSWRFVAGLASDTVRRADGDAALALFRQAESSAQEVLGDDHIEVAMIRNNLGQLHHARGDAAAARDSLARSLPVLLDTLGLENPVTCGAADTLQAVGGAPFEIARAILGEEGATRLAQLLGPAS